MRFGTFEYLASRQMAAERQRLADFVIERFHPELGLEMFWGITEELAELEVTMANLAQLVNVLPLIVTGPDRAAATAIYGPFLLYRQMERLVARQAQLALPLAGVVGR